MDHGPADLTANRKALFSAESDYGTMYNMIIGHNIAQITRCAAIFSFADHLAAGPATAEQIAKAECLNIDATFRLMRACASIGLMTYDKALGFTATPLLKTLSKDDPRSLRDMAIVQAGQGHWAPWGQLSEAIKTGESQAQATLGSTVWDYFETPAGAEEAQAFTRAMGGLTKTLLSEAPRLIDTASVSFAVDVGGAAGSLIHSLLKQNLALRGAVLELPHAVANARSAAEAERLEDRLSIIEGNFFTEVPPADMYLLKNILHDWPDDACIEILRNCRRAMKPGGRVILIEIVMDDSPSSFVTHVDLTMLVVLGAKERTLAQFQKLLDAAGFSFTGLTPTATPFSLIEATPKVAAFVQL
jgi:hypothetical protein